MGNTYNRVYIWCCKYDENRYRERCANKWWCASKHTGLLNSYLGKWYLIPYLVVLLISARVSLISTRVSAHCQAILLPFHKLWAETECLKIILGISHFTPIKTLLLKGGWPNTPIKRVNDIREEKNITKTGFRAYSSKSLLLYENATVLSISMCRNQYCQLTLGTLLDIDTVDIYIP